MGFSGYNDPEVVSVAVTKEQVKALIDGLNEEQLQALWVILHSMAWPAVDVTPEDESDIKKGVEDLESGRKVSADDVWKELGI